jgi:cephalosporin hydroxylase
MVYYNFYYVPANGVSDLNEGELEYLWELLSGRPFKFYIEVGIGCLGTICSMAGRIKENRMDCRCIGIDAFGELPQDIAGSNSHQGDVIRIEEAKELLVKLQFDRIVTLYKGDSSVVLGEILEPVRHLGKLIFIDANHTYEGCLADFTAADRHVTKGDIVVFHDTIRFQHPDYGRGPRGVIEDRLLNNPRYTLLRFPPPDVAFRDDVNTASAFEATR